jgi:capsular exopolysaccharide synthesis family protein
VHAQVTQRPESTPARSVMPTSELEAFVALLGRGKWIILIATVVAVVVVAFSISSEAKVYRASTLLQVNAPITSSQQADQVTASKALAATYSRRLTDRGFLTWAASKIPGETAGDLGSRLSVKAIPDTQLIELGITGNSRDEASRLAERVAQLAVTDVRIDSTANTNAAAAVLRTDADRLTAQINELTAKQQAAASVGRPEQVNTIQDRIDVLRQQRTNLNTAIAAVQTQGVQQAVSVRQPHPATSSSSPISPKPVFDVVLALFFGLVVGIVLAWIRDQLDHTIRSLREVESISGRPVLASIPLVRSGPTAANGRLANAYDVLRVNLAMADQTGKPPQLIAVTSGNEGEGKSSACVGLGASLARAGRRVLLLDADIRKCGLSRSLGMNGSRGLTEVVRGELSLDEAITKSDGIEVLPAGGGDSSPPALLDSRPFEDLLADLRDRYDVVVVDTPAVRPVADATLAAARCDAVLLVARVGSVQRSEFASAVQTVSTPPLLLLGTVAFGGQASERPYYSYEPERVRGGFQFMNGRRGSPGQRADSA